MQGAHFGPLGEHSLWFDQRIAEILTEYLVFLISDSLLEPPLPPQQVLAHNLQCTVLRCFALQRPLLLRQFVRVL